VSLGNKQQANLQSFDKCCTHNISLLLPKRIKIVHKIIYILKLAINRCFAVPTEYKTDYRFYISTNSSIHRDSLINLSTNMYIDTHMRAGLWYILFATLTNSNCNSSSLGKGSHLYIYMYIHIWASCKATSQTGIIANPLHTDGRFKCMYFFYFDVSHLPECANRFLIKTANEICKHIVWL